jgi:hypothetical protein
MQDASVSASFKHGIKMVNWIGSGMNTLAEAAIQPAVASPLLPADKPAAY